MHVYVLWFYERVLLAFNCGKGRQLLKVYLLKVVIKRR